MRQTKNFVVLVLCMCIMFGGLAVPMMVNAESNVEASKASQGVTKGAYISVYSANLSISDSGVASVSGLVRGRSGTTNTSVKCILQRDVSGTWVDVKTWTDSNNNSASTVNTTYQLFSHGTYRVYMECSANNETKTATSAYRTY